MGKDLKGKELGVGISQRKDGLYTARFTGRDGKRKQIEAGMKPKTLQTILGHSNIGITMNLYVHVTDVEKEKEIRNIEDMIKII